MRSGTKHLILAPADAGGILVAASLRRRLSLREDVQFLTPRELTRRLSGLSEEPSVQTPVVVNLLPTDSVKTLLIPALERLSERGARAQWFYSRTRPAPLLHLLSEFIELNYEEGGSAWAMVLQSARDLAFVEFVTAIEDRSTDVGRAWRVYLRALAASWDWSRMYHAVTRLADLSELEADDIEWGRAQLMEVQRAATAVQLGSIRPVDGQSVAIVDDPTVAARVRPDVLRRVRTDVGLVIFAAGPTRLVALATGRDSSFGPLDSLRADPDVVLSTVTGARVDVAWDRGHIPPSVRQLIGDDLCEELLHGPTAGEVARIVHSHDERIAKGMEASALAEIDLAAIGGDLGVEG